MGAVCSVARIHAAQQGGPLQVRRVLRVLFCRNAFFACLYAVVLALPYIQNEPPPDLTLEALPIAVLVMLTLDAATTLWILRRGGLVAVQATLLCTLLTVGVYAVKEGFTVQQLLTKAAPTKNLYTFYLPLAIAAFILLSKALQAYVVSILLRRMRAGSLPPLLDVSAPLLPVVGQPQAPVVVGQPVTPIAGEPLDTPARN